jgi:lysophospholipid acyltransferase (LPLAT)-like uncharacterized protein
VNIDCLIAKAARPVEIYLSAAAKRIEVQVVIDENGELRSIDARELDTIFAEILSSPVVLPLWNAHSLLILCAYLSLPALRKHAGSFEAVADNSLGGILTQALYRRTGLAGRQLSLTPPEERLSDIKDILVQRPNLVIAADSHGPYRSVGTGMARIVRQYEGNVRPISAISSRSLPVFRQIKMAIPLPSSATIIGIGAPMGSSVAAQSLSRVRDSLQRALSVLENNLRGLLATQLSHSNE